MSDKNAGVNVSIIIKALNEEKRIEAAIETALSAVFIVGGEVVLADSCSIDRTMELAYAYPIRIVQLMFAAERCCGIGPQLGYQHSFGEFVYILDGDMEMLPDFLPAALQFLKTHPHVAGVGGRVMEMNTVGLEYIARIARGSAHMQQGEVDRLDMGGLYRRSAIEQTGYFSDRNLHSYEELDLAIRLRHGGWKLWRLDIDAVKHHGHDVAPYVLLFKRWKTLYICGLGEMLRAAQGSSRFWMLLECAREVRLYGAVILVWVGLVILLSLPLSIESKVTALAVCLILPLCVMSWRKRSVVKAAYSLVSWMLNAAGLVRGLLRRRSPPAAPIESLMVKDIFAVSRDPVRY